MRKKIAIDEHLALSRREEDDYWELRTVCVHALNLHYILERNGICFNKPKNDDFSFKVT